MYRSCTIYLNLDVCRIYFWLTIHQHPILQGSPHFQRTGRLDFSLREHEGKVKALQGDFQRLHRDMFLQKCVVSWHHLEKKMHLKCAFADILSISFIFNFKFMFCTCIIMSPKQSLGDILCLLRFFLLLLLYSSFFLPPKVYSTHFSATTERKSMELHRNVKHYE